MIEAMNGANGMYALQNYTYNSSTGNLSSKAGISYTYGDTNHDHAVTAMGSDSFTYDANGNQVTRNVSGSAYTLGYDAENRLVSVSGAASATFVYDGDGNRVKATVAGATTTYIGSYFEWAGSISTMKKYYYGGNTRVAMRTGNSTINYLLGDQLGSTAITTNSSGVKSAEIRYYPWGTTRYLYGTTPTTYRFTGQRLESGIGLYFYNARWYDPVAGRFVSADTVIPEQQGVQAWDRYAYVNNNPIKYIDPSGNRKCTSEEAATGDETCEQNYPENEPDYVIHRALLGTHQIPKIGSDITAPEKTIPSIVNYLLTVIGNAILALSNEQSNMIDIYTWITWNEYNDGNISIQGITINNYSNDTTIYFHKVDISASKYLFTSTPYGILGQNQEIIKYAIRPINREYLYTSYPGSTHFVNLNTKEPICEFPIIDSTLSVNLTALISISTGKIDDRTIINSSYTYSIPPR